MKKGIKILSLSILLSIAYIGLAQNPPDPDNDPNTDGGTELGGNAPVGSGILLLTVLGGAYAMGRTYSLKKRKK